MNRCYPISRIYLLGCILFLLFPLSFHGQVLNGREANGLISGAEVIRLSPYSTVPGYVRFQKGREVALEDWGLFCEKVLGFSEADGMERISQNADESQIRLRQKYKDIPVEGGQIILHLTDGHIGSFNGDFFRGISLSTQPSLTARQARKFAFRAIQAQRYQFGLPQGTLVIAPFGGDYQQGDFRLAWKFDIYAQQPLSRNYVFVDAHSGEIIDTWNRIHSTDKPGIAHTRYSGVRQIITDSVPQGNPATTFRLRESGRGQGIETLNLEQTANYQLAKDFWDDDNTWDLVNPEQDEVATDVHWGTEQTYDYFLQIHGRNGMDGNGFRLQSFVHYGSGIWNAFWDGLRMVYGDGNGIFGPLTTLDVVAHEITHGLTEFSAGLIYRNESGALNESFSDIFGVAIDYFARPDSANWLIGEESGRALRSLADPNSLGSPRNYLGTDWFTGTADNGGVHLNSGVQNYWFYLLSEGGSGTNDFGDAYNVSGIGIDKAARIAFRMLTTYLTPISRYEDARFYAIQSAIDLFGPCTPEVEATANAWYAVGLGDPYAATVSSDFEAAPLAGCSVPFQVSFQNLSFNAGGFLWDFGDGNTSTQAFPVHTYSQLGTFTVSLTADGGSCGSQTESKVAYIDLDSANPCVAFMPSSGVGITQTDCQGTLYDDGGGNSDYQNNSSSIITLAPLGASTVSLQFTLFDFEQDYDYLYIYDGPDTSAPLIGVFTGNSLPGGGTITSTGHALTLEQYSDPFLTGAGFEATWSCAPISGPPTAGFLASDSISCTGEITFIDRSLGGVTSWSWDFGEGNSSNLPSPSHRYTASGIFPVSLIVTNGFGADTLLFSPGVEVNLPVAPVASDLAICRPGQAMLRATGTAPLFWYDQNQILVGQGSVLLSPPLSGPTTFFVRTNAAQPLLSAGPADNTFGNGGYFDRDTRHLVFDVFEDLVLESVKVYANGDGFRSIQLRDTYGRVLQQVRLYVTDGEFLAELGFHIPPGKDYQLGISGPSDLFRNDEDANYPYEVTGLLSIHSSNSPIAPLENYYFFYDWQVRQADCESPSVPVNITISGDSGPAMDFSWSQVNSVFTFEENTNGGMDFLWNFGDGNSATGPEPTHQFPSAGTFEVTLAASDSNCQALMTQSVPVSIALAGEDLIRENEWRLFPNPGSGKSWLWRSGELALQTEMEVYNSMGQRIFTQKINAAKFELDLSLKPAGAYFIRIQEGQHQWVLKYLLIR